jgi:competence protein ComEC
VVCLFDPGAVTAAGFWLSFGAVAASARVVHGRPYVRGPFGWSVLKTAARVQIAVTLALLPAMVLLFHQISLVSPLANAVAIPIVSWVVTPLALLGAACAALPWPLTTLAESLLTSANGLFGALAAALQWISAPAWVALALPAPPLPLLLIAMLGIAWCLAPPGWPLRWAGL